MKTTLDLPDDLLIEAKAVAARRRTTLKAIVEHALRREIQTPGPAASTPGDRYHRDELGFLVLKRGPDATVSPETVRKIQDDLDQEDLQRALRPADPR